MTEPPLPMTDPTALSIVGLVMTEVQRSEARIIRELTSNAEAAKGRWRAHDEEHTELAKAVKEVAKEFADHIAAEREEDIRFKARIGPITTTGRWIVREWRTVAIISLLVADFLGQLGSALGLIR